MTPPRPRLLWLTQGNSSNLPSQRLRVLEIMPFIDSAFVQTCFPAPTGVRAAWRLRTLLRQADVVVLQKELVTRVVLWLLRLFARRLAYDFDDAVYVRLLADGQCRPSAKRRRRFAAICRAADLVIAGNAILEAAARGCGARRTTVLPTGVALPPELPLATAATGCVRLGWIGTDVNLPYIEALEPVFLQLQREGLSFVLQVMAGRAPRFREFDAVEFTRWSAAAEQLFLTDMDVGLMPLADNEHTRGKCAYKALQYMSLGKPVVASDVGVNAAWTAAAGLAVASETETLSALRCLIGDASLRAKMGATGRARVEREFARPIIAAAMRAQLLSLIRCP